MPEDQIKQSSGLLCINSFFISNRTDSIMKTGKYYTKNKHAALQSKNTPKQSINTIQSESWCRERLLNRYQTKWLICLLLDPLQVSRKRHHNSHSVWIWNGPDQSQRRQQSFICPSWEILIWNQINVSVLYCKPAHRVWRPCWYFCREGLSYVLSK